MLEIQGLTKQFGGLFGRGRPRLHRQCGRYIRADRSERRGKDDGVQRDYRVLAPDERTRRLRRKGHNGQEPHRIAATGLVRTFQATNICPDFTVLENVVLSCHLKPGVGFFEAFLRTRSGRRKEQAILDRSHAILELVGLKAMAHLVAGSLAHGHKRTLGIAWRWRPNRSCSCLTNRLAA